MCTASSLPRRFARSKVSRDAMNSLPCPAQLLRVVSQGVHNLPDLTTSESIILPEFWRSGPAVQMDYSLTATANHMDVGGPMIVGIDHNPEPVKGEHRGHDSTVP